MNNWLQNLNQALAKMVLALQHWMDRTAERLELFLLRLRWRYDQPGDRYIRGEQLIDHDGEQYWLRFVSGNGGYTVTRHLPFTTLLEAMRAERNRA